MRTVKSSASEELENSRKVTHGFSLILTDSHGGGELSTIETLVSIVVARRKALTEWARESDIDSHAVFGGSIEARAGCLEGVPDRLRRCKICERRRPGADRGRRAGSAHTEPLNSTRSRSRLERHLVAASSARDERHPTPNPIGQVQRVQKEFDASGQYPRRPRVVAHPTTGR
jgi:hypothetical protein